MQHPSILGTHLTDWRDEAACESMARAIAQQGAVRQAFITLQGPLGAGKTTFARALLRELGVTGRIKSPTFALLEPYVAGATTIAHIDLYRMDDAREFDDAGLRDEIAGAGLKLVEWPERAGASLPTPDLAITIEVLGDETRRVRLDACTPCGAALVHAASRSAVVDEMQAADPVRGHERKPAQPS